MHSRLFVSADLIGSTARKQNEASAKTWIGDVLAFYQQFPSKLALRVDEHVAKRAEVVKAYQLEDRPQLWKAVGDELIFSVIVHSEHDVRVVVDAWRAAMIDTELSTLRKSGMSLKGAAWIATFPLPDREVAVASADTFDPAAELTDDDADPDLQPEVVNRRLLNKAPSTVMCDYIGPSIDIGFRVAGLATDRKFPISVEVAWALVVSDTHKKEGDDLEVYFDGTVELKGVWGGRGYPFLWLDMGKHLPSQKHFDTLASLHPARHETIRSLAHDLHRSINGSLAGESASESRNTSTSWPCRIHLGASTHPEFRCHEEAITLAESKLAEIDDSSGDFPDLEFEGDSEANADSEL